MEIYFTPNTKPVAVSLKSLNTTKQLYVSSLFAHRLYVQAQRPDVWPNCCLARVPGQRPGTCGQPGRSVGRTGPQGCGCGQLQDDKLGLE